jgi:glycine cleavage system H protein
VNSKVSSEPQLVNQSPFEKGWLYKIEIANPADLDKLMDASTYDQKKSKGH